MSKHVSISKKIAAGLTASLMLSSFVPAQAISVKDFFIINSVSIGGLISGIAMTCPFIIKNKDELIKAISFAALPNKLPSNEFLLAGLGTLVIGFFGSKFKQTYQMKQEAKELLDSMFPNATTTTTSDIESDIKSDEKE